MVEGYKGSSIIYVSLPPGEKCSAKLLRLVEDSFRDYDERIERANQGVEGGRG